MSSYNAPIISVNWQNFDLSSPGAIHFSLYTPYEGSQQQIRVTLPNKTGDSDTNLVPSTSTDTNTDPTNERILRLHIFTPPFCTNFPHLTVDLSMLSNPLTTIDQIKKQTKYLDLSLLGAGYIQRVFRKWMDDFDDLLLDFIFNNQRLIGKANESKEILKTLQRRSFRARVCAKTGRRYEDSCIFKCKAFAFRGKPTIASAIENMIPCFDKDNVSLSPTDINFRDMVAVSIRYDGCYARPGIGFGNMWCLLAVKDYGQMQDCPTVMATPAGEIYEEGEIRNPIYQFPEIEDANDFPQKF